MVSIYLIHVFVYGVTCYTDMLDRIGIGINTSTAFTVFHESKRIWPFNKILTYIPYLTKAVSLRMQHVFFLNQLLEKRRKAQDTEPDLYVFIHYPTDLKNETNHKLA